MIALSFPNIDLLKRMHFEAVKSYVRDIMRNEARDKFYCDVVSLPGFEHFARQFDSEEDSFDWLEKFILAEFPVLQSWVQSCPDKLKFDSMKRLYLNRFASGRADFVDRAAMYNSNVLFEKMGIKVCPYCEHEFIETVTVGEDNRQRRTMEFDHFYPKGDDEYPGLAMCFYNLIPSCKPCNNLKMTNPVAASPYDSEIESFSHFGTDLPVGINMHTVSDEQCEPKLNPTDGMVTNNISLAIEQRYKQLSPEVRHLLTTCQDFDDNKLREMERCGFGTFDQLKNSMFGNPRSIASGKELHTKMKKDLIDY